MDSIEVLTLGGSQNGPKSPTALLFTVMIAEWPDSYYSFEGIYSAQKRLKLAIRLMKFMLKAFYSRFASIIAISVHFCLLSWSKSAVGDLGPFWLPPRVIKIFDENF